MDQDLQAIQDHLETLQRQVNKLDKYAVNALANLRSPLTERIDAVDQQTKNAITSLRGDMNIRIDIVHQRREHAVQELAHKLDAIAHRQRSLPQ